MEPHAHALWLSAILFDGRVRRDQRSVTIGSLGAQRWVIEAMQTEGYIDIGFPFNDEAVLTVTEAGQRFLQRRGP